MTFDIKFSAPATKFFRKLEPHIQLRVKEKFKEIAEDPYRFIEHHEGDCHKLRVGDLRALVDIDNSRSLIFVRILDKRGRIYKGRSRS